MPPPPKKKQISSYKYNEKNYMHKSLEKKIALYSFNFDLPLHTK